MDGSADEGSGEVKAVTEAEAGAGQPGPCAVTAVPATEQELEDFIAAGRAKVSASLVALQGAAEHAEPQLRSALQAVEASVSAAAHALLSHIAAGLHPAHVTGSGPGA